MNIFALDKNPIIAAENHCDKHLIKMILETAQILSTAHRVIDGTQIQSKSKTNRNIKRWVLNDSRETLLYSVTHINHPSTVWARTSQENYTWLWVLMDSLCKTYTKCFKKIHKCEAIGLLSQLKTPPKNIKYGNFTMPTPAMPEACKIEAGVVESYRNYYIKEKSRMFSWTNREIPKWLIRLCNESSITYKIIEESNAKGITNKLVLDI